MNTESINLSAMTAEELADRYNCKLQLEFKDGKAVPTGAFYVYNHRLMRQEGAYDEIARHKDEIKALLLKRHDDEVRAWEERKAKIAVIPGLKEIVDAIDDLTQWHEEFSRSFDERHGAGCGGLGVRAKPQYDLDAMRAQYPRAAAYIKMHDWSRKEFIEQAIIGKKALEKIINDDHWEQAVADAEKELDDYITAHIWD